MPTPLRTLRSRVLPVATLLVLLGAGPAEAQWGTPAPQPAQPAQPNPWAQPQPQPPPGYDAYGQPQYGQPQYGQPQYAQPYGTYQPPGTVSPVPVVPPPTQPKFYGLMAIGVPIFLDVNHELMRPGANLRFEGGLDLRYVAFFLDFGFRWTPVDFPRYTSASGDTTYAGYGRSPMRSFYFGPGLRIQYPDAGRILPYASVALDLNWWNFWESGVSCGGYYYWYCSSYSVYRFTPGFSGRLGAAIEIGAMTYVDLGFGLSMSFPGSFFDRNEKWIEPYIGFMHRR